MSESLTRQSGGHWGFASLPKCEIRRTDFINTYFYEGGEMWGLKLWTRMSILKRSTREYSTGE